MLPFEDRYTRQRQLAEVGRQGQERLQNSQWELARSAHLTPFAKVVAAEYLRRAGVIIDNSLTLREAKTSTQDPQAAIVEHLRFAGPSNVAAGALAALQHVRSVLGLVNTKPASTLGL